MGRRREETTPPAPPPMKGEREKEMRLPTSPFRRNNRRQLEVTESTRTDTAVRGSQTRTAGTTLNLRTWEHPYKRPYERHERHGGGRNNEGMSPRRRNTTSDPRLSTRPQPARAEPRRHRRASPQADRQERTIEDYKKMVEELRLQTKTATTELDFLQQEFQFIKHTVLN